MNLTDVQEWNLLMRSNDVEMEELHLERKETKIMKEKEENERELRKG